MGRFLQLYKYWTMLCCYSNSLFETCKLHKANLQRIPYLTSHGSEVVHAWSAGEKLSTAGKNPWVKLSTRRRKKKCDGEEPCGHCKSASYGPLECEYAPLGELSESQMLEQSILSLEGKIYDLEHPEEHEASLIRLHKPYTHSAPVSSPFHRCEGMGL